MKDWRNAFDIPADVAYFNCASFGPLMRSAREVGEAALRRHAEPWRIDSTAWYGEPEERRRLFAEVMGCDVEGVALVPATSYGFATAAKNIKLNAGQRILVLADEFPSGVHTWRRKAAETGAEIITVAKRDGETWTDAVLAALNDERIAVVSVPNVHWHDGALVDLPPIAARAREIGAKLVLDTSQSGSVVPIDFAAVQPDYVMNVGYKWLMGPLGLGYLYVGPAHREGVPLEENWLPRLGSEDFSRLAEYEERYRPGARRFDSGQHSAYDITPAAIAALKQIVEWRTDNLEGRLRERTDAIVAGAAELGLAVTSKARGPHLLGLRLAAGQAPRAAEIFRERKVIVGFRGEIVRVAAHLYNTEDDIARLLGALREIVAS